MKKHILLTLTVLLLVFLTGGCKNKETAESYVGEQITSMKEENSEAFSSLLEKGIADSGNQYVLEFPQELKAPYLQFLQNAFSAIEFEVSKARKTGDDSYSVMISFKPLDIDASTKIIREDYTQSMASPDLAEAVCLLIETSTEALESEPVFLDETSLTLTVKETEKGYSIEKKDMSSFLGLALLEYMSPYDTVCEILDARDYMQAYLDASLKGDVSRFAQHAKISEDEALAWYDETAFSPPGSLSPAYMERYATALKTICGQCQYTVGIPKKVSDMFNYDVDITVIPNYSLKNALSELSAHTFTSEEDVDRVFIELLEQYAKSPAYGDETTVTVPLNIGALNSAGEEGSEYANLANVILPVE